MTDILAIDASVNILIPKQPTEKRMENDAAIEGLMAKKTMSIINQITNYLKVAEMNSQIKMVNTFLSD